ncbi:MAG: hypothetical protein NVS1B2_22420 [Vulcanimicrobiaceae bacterium]
MVTTTFAAPATANVAGAAARTLLEHSPCSFVRVWMSDGFGSAGAIATAGVPAEGKEMAVIEAALAIGAGRRSLEPITSDGTPSGMPVGYRICVPLRTSAQVFGCVECYTTQPVDFTVAATIESSLANFAIALESAAATEALERNSRGTVLVVDDDPAIRLLIGHVLRASGFSIREAQNGRDALAWIATETPDLVLMDWTMPVLDGLDTTLELKADARTRGIPIVMLTAFSDPSKRIAAMEAGVQDFMTKPFEARDLVTRVSQFLRWRELLARKNEAGTESAPPARKRRLSPTESLAMYESRHGNLSESLELFVTEAESCDAAQRFEEAARAYRGAALVAARMREDDLGNKFTRLAGKMYLSLAETTKNARAIENAYVAAAKCFLEAGNLQLVTKSIALAASFESMADEE